MELKATRTFSYKNVALHFFTICFINKLYQIWSKSFSEWRTYISVDKMIKSANSPSNLNKIGPVITKIFYWTLKIRINDSNNDGRATPMKKYIAPNEKKGGKGYKRPKVCRKNIESSSADRWRRISLRVGFLLGHNLSEAHTHDQQRKKKIQSRKMATLDTWTSLI